MDSNIQGIMCTDSTNTLVAFSVVYSRKLRNGEPCLLNAQLKIRKRAIHKNNYHMQYFVNNIENTIISSGVLRNFGKSKSSGSIDYRFQSPVLRECGFVPVPESWTFFSFIDEHFSGQVKWLTTASLQINDSLSLPTVVSFTNFVP